MIPEITVYLYNTNVPKKSVKNQKTKNMNRKSQKVNTFPRTYHLL